MNPLRQGRLLSSFQPTTLRRFSPALRVLAGLTLASPVFGQASSQPCPPISERTSALETCTTASESLGRLPPPPVFWHLDVYSKRTEAEEAKVPRGTVVESLGKNWLFTIAEARWRPSGRATIGPLPVKEDVDYTAVYLQSIVALGTTAPIHVHSEPEAFYTLTGEPCLETPEGTVTGKVVIVAASPPMLLTATGPEQRRGVVLILHDSSQPATTLVGDWTPKGLCTSGRSGGRRSRRALRGAGV